MIYFDKVGNKISPAKWHELRADHSYTTVREFANEKVSIRVIWHGALTLGESKSFRDTWPLFQISVSNANAAGEFKPDPVLDCKTFPYENIAIQAYEHFLLQWSECKVNDSGEFEEVGNELTPPPPPSPDIPTSTIRGTGTDLMVW